MGLFYNAPEPTRGGSLAKADKSIRDAVWGRTRVSPINYTLDGGANWRQVANTADRGGEAVLC